MLTVPTQRIVTFGLIAFVLIGLEQGLLGLFVSELGPKLAKSSKDLGLFFALHGLGSAVVTGSALIGWMEKKNNKRIALASLSLCLGSILIVTGDYWLLKLIAAPLLGLGFGGLSMSFNTLIVTHFSQKNAGLLNVLNGTYGLGAVAAPWLLSQRLLTGNELFVVIALASATVCVGTWNIDDRIPNRPSIASEDPNAAPTVQLLLIAFSILFIEAGLTYWMPSLLRDPSDEAAVAAAYMARFFLWFVIVRLTAAVLALWISALGFAVFGLAGIFCSLALVLIGAIPLADTSFTGAFMGLIFPNAYAWMLTKGGGGTTTGAKILLSAITGAILGPWLLGWILPYLGQSAVLCLLGSLSLATAGLMLTTHFNIGYRKSDRPQ
jgi:FHS family glucose/mannose:H+ symporter-like MFS transporter